MDKHLRPNKSVQIHSYKHDGSVHRVWKTSKVVEVNENYLITYNYRTKVIEASGRGWYTREPAICFFFPNKWYNIIAMLKKDGIHYYCNLSSPYLFDGEAIKYIDYDLDVKVFPNYRFNILDRNEYRYHAKLMEYPKEVKEIVKEELTVLITSIKKRENPFKHQNIFKIYENIKENKV